MKREERKLKERRGEATKEEQWRRDERRRKERRGKGEENEYGWLFS